MPCATRSEPSVNSRRSTVSSLVRLDLAREREWQRRLLGKDVFDQRADQPAVAVAERMDRSNHRCASEAMTEASICAAGRLAPSMAKEETVSRVTTCNKALRCSFGLAAAIAPRNAPRSGRGHG